MMISEIMTLIVVTIRAVVIAVCFAEVNSENITAFSRPTKNTSFYQLHLYGVRKTVFQLRLLYRQ